MKQVHKYPPEHLSEDVDDGTMVENKYLLEREIVGQKIVTIRNEVVKGRYGNGRDEEAVVITLDSGKKVILRDSSDCCAYTELNHFLLNPELVDHVIVGVGTTEGYQKWHIFADAGDILQLTVGWSGGNLGYYGYGFVIDVEHYVIDEEPSLYD